MMTSFIQLLSVRSLPALVTTIIIVSVSTGPYANGQVPLHQWQPANQSMYGTDVNTFGFAENGAILAGMSTGLYILPKNTERWIATSVQSSVSGIGTTPTGTILAGTSIGTYRSTNNGQSWSLINEISSQTSFTSGPNNTLYSTRAWEHGRPNSYYTSSDDGITWQEQFIENWSTISPKIVVDQDGHLFVNSYAGVYASADDGKTWQQTGIQTVVHTLHLLPDNTLLISGDEGLWEATAQGSVWEEIDNWQYSGISITPNGNYYSIFNSSKNQNEFTISGIYRFTENGSKKSRILAGINADRIGVSPDGTLWVANNYSIVRSTDSGTVWERYDKGLTDVNVPTLFTAPTGDMFALAKRGAHPTKYPFYGLYHSSDNGQSWQFLIDSLDSAPFVADSSGNIFASKQNTVWSNGPHNDIPPDSRAPLLRSSDQGRTWESIQGYGSVTDISYNSSGDIVAGFSFRRFQLGTHGGDIAISRDGGTTWGLFTEQGGPWYDTDLMTSKSVNNVVMLDDNSILFSVHESGDVGIDEGGLYRATVHNTIDTIRTDFFVQELSRTPDGNVIAAVGIMEPQFPHNTHSHGLYRSTDNGESWDLAYALPAIYQTDFSFGRNGLVFASTALGTAYRSTNYGATWSAITTTDSSYGLKDFTFHPDGSIFSRNNGYVFISTDNGETWTPLTNGLPAFELPIAPRIGSPQSLTLSKDGHVFCSIFDRGVYRLDYASNVEFESPRHTTKSLRVYSSINGTHTVRFSLKNSEKVSLRLFDVTGRQVLTLLDEYRNAGEHQALLESSHLPAGAYVLVQTTEQQTESILFYVD